MLVNFGLFPLKFCSSKVHPGRFKCFHLEYCQSQKHFVQSDAEQVEEVENSRKYSDQETKYS